MVFIYLFIFVASFGYLKINALFVVLIGQKEINIYAECEERRLWGTAKRVVFRFGTWEGLTKIIDIDIDICVSIIYGHCLLFVCFHALTLCVCKDISLENWCLWLSLLLYISLSHTLSHN